MLPPSKIRRPTPPDLPRFVGAADWKLSVRETVQRQLSLADFETPGSCHRVEPLAVSRCSRGGKTRSLYEIGNLGYTYNDGEAVPVIFVSFNDYSPLDECDQEDPLQALILRMGFAAHSETTYNNNNSASTDTQFQRFRETFDVTENDVMCWLGDSPALLIVDELNNLQKLTAREETDKKQVAKFANFIKSYFVQPAGRYFVFSTHIVSTLECFGVFMEYGSNSERGVLLQELPLVDNLATAVTLNENLKGAREAVYYGLMPGLIHDRSLRLPSSQLVKRNRAVRKHNEKCASERKKWFYKILASLINGRANLVPEELHTLLDASLAESGSEQIRWSPHFLEFVLSNLELDDANDNSLSKAMANLCRILRDSKESSGDGWESLFVLFLLARCATSTWQDPVLPAFASFSNSEEPPVVRFNRPYSFDHTLQCLDACKCWADLQKGILPGKDPTISIFYPTHAKFEVYDVIVVFSEEKAIKRIIGYQLKEGRHDARQPTEDEFAMNFVIKGIPSKISLLKSGWYLPNDEQIDDFYGVSGKYWTPKRWKQLAATDRSDE